MSAKKMSRRVAELVTTRANGVCEAGILGVCTFSAEHLHHRKLRSQGGEHTVENLVHICMACHTWIHAHPAEATRWGLIVRSVGDPAEVPVWYRGGLVTLDGSGGVTGDLSLGLEIDEEAPF